MSTILKALKRLEEDEAAGATAPRDGRDEGQQSLRDQLLGEELAATAIPPEPRARSTTPWGAISLAAVALLVIAGGVMFFLGRAATSVEEPSVTSLPDRVSPSPGTIAIVEEMPAAETDGALRVPGGLAVAGTGTPRAARQEPAPDVAAAGDPMTPSAAAPASDATQATPEVVVAVAPKPAPVAPASVSATLAVRSAAVRSSASTSSTSATAPIADSIPVESVVAPPSAAPVVEAPAPVVAPAPKPAPAPIAPPPAPAVVEPEAPVVAAKAKPTPPPVSARPADPPPTSSTSAGAADEPEPFAIVRRADVPDVRVLKTQWHPMAERRQAEIKVIGQEEHVVLHEGDAVGKLVVSDIKPSSVTFRYEDIEITRRVGVDTPIGPIRD